MRSIRLVVPAVVLLTALAGCGGGAVPGSGTTASPGAPAATPAPTSDPAPDPAADEAEIETVFVDYNQALVDGDFATACELSAPETVETLLAQTEEQLGTAPGSCEEAFEAIYAATPEVAEVTDEIAETAQLQDIVVDGDTAMITWSAQVSGQTTTSTNNLRRVEGEWRLVDTE